MFQFQGCADVWNKTAVKQCCRWLALFHASAHHWNWNKTLKQPETVLAFAHPNWNKTKLSTIGWNEVPTVGSFVLFQFYFTMCNGLKTQFVFAVRVLRDKSFHLSSLLTGLLSSCAPGCASKPGGFAISRIQREWDIASRPSHSTSRVSTTRFAYTLQYHA